MKQKQLAKKIGVWLTLGLFAAEPLSMGAAPILPDTHAPADRQPLVMETASGVPLVQITAPTAGGVSRNQYTDFNVPGKGAILNNSYRMSETKLAGYVQGNNNMARGSAKIIVNEVTSARPTAMNGFLEVAGDRASVVIANPNGITVNGGGFINTSRAILTTGRPVYGEEGNLTRFDIADGTVSFEGNGMDSRETDSLTILSRAVRVNAGVWANDLHVVTGANRVDAENYAASRTEAAGEHPDVALDVSAVGGMYAGRISIVGTEKGLGVNMAGTLSATEAVSLDQSGALKVSGTLYSGGTGHIHAEGVENTHAIAAAGDLSIDSTGDIANSGSIGAGITEDGTLTKAGTLTLAGETIRNDGAHLLGGSAVRLTGKTLSNAGGEVYSGGDAALALRASIRNDSGTIASERTMTVRTGAMTQRAGKTSAGGALGVTAASLDNTSGSIATDQSAAISVSGAFTNTKGSVTSGGDASIQAGSLALDGVLAAGKDLTVTAGSDLSNAGSEDGYGITKAAGDLTLDTDKTITNAKKIEAGGLLTLRAGTVQNEAGGEINGGRFAVTAGTIDNTGLLSADTEGSLTADALYNRENGRIYGENLAIKAGSMENRKNQDLEDKLAVEIQNLNASADELEAAFAADVTAFTNKSQQDAYLQQIQTLTDRYAAQKAVVDAVKADMAGHKSGAVAARGDLSITGDTLLNSADALLYSGGHMTIRETDAFTNRGGDVEAQGALSLTAPEIKNENNAFSARRLWTSTVTNPEKIRIDEGGHPEHGQVFDADEFSELESGYGAYHNKGIQPKEIYDLAKYDTVEKPDPDDTDPDDPPIPAEAIGKQAPNYDYDDPIFKELGVQSMTTPRPGYDQPDAQAAWDAQYQKILDQLNTKIEAYNAEAEAYNNSIGAVESAKIKLYTIIRTQTWTSEEKVESTRAGEITSGGDMHLTGHVTNTNSRIVSGGTLKIEGRTDNIAKENQVQSVTFGTTQESYTKKKKWPHKAWRRHYREELFMTPQEEKSNPQPLGIAAQEGETGTHPETADITEAQRDNVASSLDPFHTAEGKPSAAGGGAVTDTLRLPESAVYHIHDDSTSKYLVETDPAFTNKKNFLSSDYMYEQMKWDPDKVAKRLGDGFYEQELVRQQIESLTGSRYLSGYAGEEDEYKALMDAGVTFAKEQHLTPGVALTAEQAAALTSDIVWMETTTVEVHGKEMTVVYPHVYLRKSDDMTLTKDGALMSGKQLVIDTKEAVRNTGTLYGGSVTVASGSLDTAGRIEGRKVDLSALGDIRQSGLITGDDVSLKAGGSIHMDDTVDHLKNQDVLNRTAGIAVQGKEGVLLMSAGKDLHLTGATLASLGEKGSVILRAGGDVTMDTNTLSAKKDMTENSDNYLRTYRKTETANTVLAEGDISITAGDAMHLRNTTAASGEGKVALTSGGDMTLENGETESRDEYGIKYKQSGFLSSKTTTVKSDDYHKGVTGSLLSGETVTLTSGGDTMVKGSAVVGDKDVDIHAGGAVTIESAEALDRSVYEKQVKKSGLLGGGGLGFTIGKEQRKDSYDSMDRTQVGSAVGSLTGNVTIHAGQEATVKASDVAAGKDIDITGKEVTITSADNISHTGESHEYKRSGLSVSLSGGAVDAAAGIAGTVQHGTEVQDKRLAALYGYETYEQGKKIYDAAQKGKLGKDSLHVNIGIGSSSMKYNARSDSTTARGSQVAAGGDVTVKSENDLTVHGSTVAGQNVTLKAGKDISITAAENTMTNRTDSSNHSAGAGVSLSTQGAGVYGYANAGKGKENGTVVAHTGSQVIAGDTLAMESGKDTTITGSKATGGKVEVHTEGDLNIESLQDQNNYVSKTTQTGASAAIAGGMTVVSGGAGKQDMHSNYASVTDQAGIYAGKNGYDITVEGNTDLKGAVIDSEAPAEKNHLTTGTLSWEDIGNKADYKASGSGINVSEGFGSDKAGSKTNDQLPLNYKGITPSIAPTVKGDASSTTKAGISAGTITITDKEHQKQNLDSLNRDTKDSLNKLQEIFDKAKVEEKQELAALFSQAAYEKVGDIADKQGWAEDDPRRVALHGLVGGMTAGITGGSIASGAAGAMTMEGLQPVLDKFLQDHPDLRQWSSAVIGSAVGAVTGDTDAGRYNAWAGNKFNWLTHEQYEEYVKELMSAKSQQEQKVITQKWKNIDNEQGEDWLTLQGDGAYIDPFGTYGGGLYIKGASSLLHTAERSAAEEIGALPMNLAEKNGANLGYAKYLTGGKFFALEWGLAAADDGKHYSGIEWWKAQGVNVVVPSAFMAGSLYFYSTGHPIIASALSAPVIGAVVQDRVSQLIKDNILETDDKKKEDEKEGK